MKVVLISPHPDAWTLGLRILSSCLKREGHDVVLLLLMRQFSQRYEQSILDDVAGFSRGADLIGISLMTNYFDNAVQITRSLKKSSNIPVVWGGVHPTIRPEECLAHADMVCIGEGEDTLVEFVDAMEGGRFSRDIEGMWFNDGGRIIKNPLRPLIEDLDRIPFPDYDYDSSYILSYGRLSKMDEHMLERWMFGDLVGCPTYVTLASRGCPFSCTYCWNDAINKMYPHRKSVRKRSIGNIIEELVEAKKKLPFIGSIGIDDDAFFSYSTEEIREFSKKYRERVQLPLRITGFSPLTLNREKLSLLVDAGLNGIRMGIQTGSERTLKLYNRHCNNQHVERAVKAIHEFKDRVMPSYDIILDNPWETDDDLIETLMFLAKLPTPYVLSLFSLMFYPGTELYRKARSEGIVTDDLEDVYRKEFTGCKKTYLNRLFFLVQYYASTGRRGISPRTMSVLTNKKVRSTGLHWLLYAVLSAPRCAHLLGRRLKAVLAAVRYRLNAYREGGGKKGAAAAEPASGP